jgi:peptidoglycan/xylan/chitin deacetylase (PgdA/CDA1 family)
MNPPGTEIPILTYHSIDSSGSVISTAPENFRRQMEVLRRSSTQVLSLKDVALHLRERKIFPENAVVITFDDGFRNVFKVAFPVLKDFGFRPTIFLVTSFCGKDNRWYGQPDRIPILELMSWDEIAQMSEFIDFGVHTASHPDLTQLQEKRLEEEILGAQQCLEERTGVKKQAFAYPYGKQTKPAKDLVQKHFFAGCSTEMDFVSLDSDIYFLPRIDMYYFSNNESFEGFGTSAFRRYLRFRGWLRRIREVVTK